MRLGARVTYKCCTASVQRRCLSEGKPEKNRVSAAWEAFKGPEEPGTFSDFLKQVDKDNKQLREDRGLVNTEYKKYRSLMIIPEDEINDEDQKVEILLSAMALYKQKEPRLRTDHVEFGQWMIKRIWEFDLAHRVELYEELVTLLPPFKYQTPTWIERLLPKPSPGLHMVTQLITMMQQKQVKPSYKLYRNIYRVFGKSHPVCARIRWYGWWYHIMSKSNPYPLPDESYDFDQLSNNSDHLALAKYVADRTMAQDVTFSEIRNAENKHIGTHCLSQTQRDLATLQVPDDVMRLTGPHSIWCGRVQRWYWVLRREERGDEFEGAALSMVVTPNKDSKEAAMLMLQNMQTRYVGIAGSTILLEEPTEVLTLDPYQHHKERKKFFGFKDAKDQLGDTEISTITEGEYREEVLQRESEKQFTKTSNTFTKTSNTFTKRGSRHTDDDDDW